MPSNTIAIQRSLLQQLSTTAAAGARLRTNHNFHTPEAEEANRLLNAVEPGSYIQPHRHSQRSKDESILVVRGRMKLHLEAEDGRIQIHELGPGEHARIPTGCRHRFEAVERVEIVEVSTPELEDVVRVEDDFGRKGSSAP